MSKKTFKSIRRIDYVLPYTTPDPWEFSGNDSTGRHTTLWNYLALVMKYYVHDEFMISYHLRDILGKKYKLEYDPTAKKWFSNDPDKAQEMSLVLFEEGKYHQGKNKRTMSGDQRVNPRSGSKRKNKRNKGS